MTCRYALAGLLLLVLAGVMAARTASAGGTVRSVALAQQPHAVVVDTRTSRALVTSYGADRRSGVVSVLDTTTAKAGHEYSRAACERVAAMTERQAVQAFDAVYCLGDIGGDASQPNAVQDLIMPLGCPAVLGSYDKGVGSSTDTPAVHIPIPCTVGVQ